MNVKTASHLAENEMFLQSHIMTWTRANMQPVLLQIVSVVHLQPIHCCMTTIGLNSRLFGGHRSGGMKADIAYLRNRGFAFSSISLSNMII